MNAQRRVTTPPINSAGAVTNSMRADDSPDRMQIPSELSPVFSPPGSRTGAGRGGTGLRAHSPGPSSFSSGLPR
jgi:hypothetical protein